ncbi:efflux transporter outer membrane subunit [Lutimonas sp.]|uniref:efflux transporter outer membrane subunit n=1 Tax=Lutimonas sp. TaxID=1872403 RepID=UPI003D9BA434
MKKIITYGLLLFLVSFLALNLGSCKVGEDYERQMMPGPETYRQEFPKDSSISNLPWWQLFNDTILVDLIHTALVNNKSIQVAISRIEESRLQIEIAKADYYPAIGYNAYGSSLANSEVSGLSNQAGGGINVSYTVDLWQKIKTMNKIALQNYFATEEAYKSLNISIIASMASAYVSLRDIDNRILIAEKTAVNFQENLDVMQARFNAGFISEVDLSQSKIQLSEALTALEIFGRSRGQIENAISVLMGTAPTSIPRGLPLYEQITIPEIPVGLPSELIDRRPDIRQAERRLHAQTLRIGVAEALKYPSLTLSLDMGAQLVNPSFLFADLGAQLLGPIFNAGRLQRNVEIEEQRTKQLLLDYENSYLFALQEVEDAMIAVETYRREYDLRNQQMEMSTKASQLSWVRYDGGLTSYLEVLNLQTSQFNAELKASEAFKNEITSIINLYQALGGGWYVDIEDVKELN